jgi:hypothetical protein
MALADQRAIEVGTLKTEITRLQRLIDGQRDTAAIGIQNRGVWPNRR